MQMKLNQRVAVITGAAQGIGAACARAFAAEGAHVVVSDVNEVGGMALVRDIATAGGMAIFCRADVGEKRDAERLVAHAVEHFGRLDVLVNNAGIVHAAEFVDLAEEDFDRVLRVNLKGAFLCGQAAVRQMLAQAPRAEAKAARLELRHGARTFELNAHSPALTLGRDAQSDVVIADPLASRLHARIERRRDKFVLVDQSSNGTFVTVDGEHELQLRREEMILRRRGSISFGHRHDQDSGETLAFACLDPEP